MPQYSHPQSSFESFVGNALSGYSMVKGFQRDAADERRRRDEARQRESLFWMNLDREGYQEVDFTVPTVEPRRNFLQSLGHRLMSGNAEPERDVRLLKMGPSAAERLAAQSREFQVADREDTQAHAATGWARDDARAAADRAAREREAVLNRGSNERVAGIHAGASRRADERARAESDREQRDQFLNELAAATGGDPVKMQGIVSARPDLMAKARRWQIPGFAYSAVADAYRQRREVSDATIDAKKRTGESYLDTKRRLERERQEREAPARGGSGTSGVAQQQAAWDRAAEALRAQGKEPESVIGPKPGASGPRNAEGIKTISPAEYRALREQGYADADVWEGLVTGGMSPDQATARVNALRGR